MEETMIVEGLGNVSFVNGILRIQTLSVGADGKITDSGSIEIPGNKVGDIISGLSSAATGISEKISTETTSTKGAEGEKSSKKKKKK